MGNYNGKPILVGRITKSQLAVELTRLLEEVTDITISRNNCRKENELLKREIASLVDEKYHLSIQLDAAKAKCESVKHTNRNLVNSLDYHLDASRYLIANPQLDCRCALKPLVCEPKTFLRRIFDYFQL